MNEWLTRLLGDVRRRESIQPLWGGHGELFRIAIGETPAVVKYARLPPGMDASTTRKRRSFDVELAFYRHVAPRCDASCRVPRLIAGDARDDEWLLVLEDLDGAGFDRRADEARGADLDNVLRWLASFHARFLDDTAEAGTYWHLGTRRDELGAIADSALRDAASTIADRLASARYQTRVHGDPKDQNFAFARDDVAAFDFQYTGRACAMVDVAYLLYGRSDEPRDGIARDHLDTYFRHLRTWVADPAIEAEWRALYPIARLDFCRFLAGWRPASWRNDERGQRFVRVMLAELNGSSSR